MMKKKMRIKLIIFVIFICSGILVTDNVDAETIYTVKNGDTVIYKANSERTAACNRMNQMASVEWSIPAGKSLKYKYQSGGSVTLKSGKYKGLPYTQGLRDYSVPTASLVQSRINDALNGTSKVKGVDCSSAVAYALRYGTGNNKSNNMFLKGNTSAYVGACFFYDAMKTTGGTTPNGGKYRNNVTKVGDYGTYSGYINAGYTDTIVNKLASGNYYYVGDIYSNVYAKIKPGDALVTYPSKGNGARHIVLVTDVVLKYNGSNIDPVNSKVYITDQNGPSSKNLSTYHGSWRTKYSIKFQDLKKVYYLPLRLNVWAESYVVSYNGNGGSFSMKTQSKPQYKAIRLSSEIPSREGYAFKGWRTSQNPVSRIYQPGDYYMEEMSDTLYAVWESNPEPSPPPAPEKEKIIKRIAGDNRYLTALQVSSELKSNLSINMFDSIIVACGYDFPDALTGSYLSKIKDAPIILVDKTMSNETSVKNYISENLKSGGTVYILGGEGAVTDRFEKSLSSFTVKRLAGDNRYDTNIAILKEAGVSNEDLLICTGSGFADSLSASAAGKPILLADSSGINNNQTKYLQSLNKGDIYLIGGEGVVSDKIGAQLKAYDKDSKVERVSGANRYKTSTAVAKKFFPSKCEAAVFAYAHNFPDGLSGGPLAMSIGSPLILTDNAGYAEAKSYSQTAGISKAIVLGGQGLISDGIISEILN